MLNSRNFYIGIGIGLIISSLILIPLNLSLANEIESINNKITPDELKQIAAEKNLYLLTEQEYLALKAQDSTETNGENGTNQNTAKPNTFTITEGMGSEQIADYLIDLGVIKDRKYFLQLLNEKDLTKKIIAGTYEYQSETSTEEIIDMITK